MRAAVQKSVLAFIFGLFEVAGIQRTGSVLAAADLDELLDVGDFGRHFGGGWCRLSGFKCRWKFADFRSSAYQIVVVSLMHARAAEGRCRVRTEGERRGVGPMWRR